MFINKLNLVFLMQWNPNKTDTDKTKSPLQTLCKNGDDFNILLSAFKLALQASFVIRYSFESLTQERGQQG